jgi:hypothetical protein
MPVCVIDINIVKIFPEMINCCSLFHVIHCSEYYVERRKWCLN